MSSLALIEKLNFRFFQTLKGIFSFNILLITGKFCGDTIIKYVIYKRRLIVQADLLNQQKDYSGAVDLYNKALDVDPVAYPAAYFNLALLSAQMGRYKSAIGYMKQYLFLVPDAADARSVQDKIYEWEIIRSTEK